MHTIYEYLFTAFIIIAIVVAASTMLTSMVTPLKMVSEQEQLKVKADELLSQILLSTGTPADWGANLTMPATDLTVFGLAKQSETTRGSYVLDADKVQRLNFRVSPLAITPVIGRDSLQLGGEYGFALEVFPVVLVTVIPRQGQENYDVTVKNNEGLPIVGANVTGRMYYVSEEKLLNLTTSSGGTSTDASGLCSLGFTRPGGQPGKDYDDTKTLAVIVDYQGVSDVEFTGFGPYTGDLYVLGDHVFVNGSCTPLASAVYEILSLRRGTGSSFGNVSFGLGPADPGVPASPGFSRYKMQYVEPSAVAFVIINDTGPSRKDLLVARRSVEIVGTAGFSTIPGAQRFPLGVQLERVVTIADQTYVFRLHLWRMSW